MLIQWQDFNGADAAIAGEFGRQWQEIRDVLSAMPLHLQASDQAGKVGNLIFDPKGTNKYIGRKLVSGKNHWMGGIPIPQEFDFLGKDIDFGKKGMIVEIQFSNYPFLLNNMLRSELFYNAKIPLNQHLTGVAVIVTKANMFPASNSTLYYEQAQRQLTSLSKYKLFGVPIRLVGLFAEPGERCPVVFTQYSGRYSREGISTKHMCRISGDTKAALTLLD